MTKITEHFTLEEMTRSETAARLGLDNIPPAELMPHIRTVAAHLETIRAHYGRTVHVTSCYRAPAVNNAVGGSPTSAHRFAFAADFEVDGVPNIEVARWCAENIPDFDQVIYEFGPTGWVHIGFTDKRPRLQLLTAVKEHGKTAYKAGIVEA